MVDFTSLLTFSHTHCISICAALVPLNLLATSGTLLLTGFDRPALQRWLTIAWASLFSGILVLHVLSWFVVGVVMLPTYVLMLLGGVCLSLNLWALLHPQSLRGILVSLVQLLKGLGLRRASLSQ
jgi:hypothetical protein